MIGRWASKNATVEVEEPKGFDAFELRLGDVMRGERATMGKSLLDVQRELRIKAAYIAAIENTDPEAFDTPGFIAGYVRSYARYLNMDPDRAFAAFCTESGFSVAHGMSAEASVVNKPTRKEAKVAAGADIFARPTTPFVPTGEMFWSRIEPGAIGSMVVLLGLIGAIGFGGYTVLQEVQRVQVAPVDQTPVVLSDLDPLNGALNQAPIPTTGGDSPNSIAAPRNEALDRLYRPQALEVPVMVARDAPISTIDPRSVGNFNTPAPIAPQAPVIAEAVAPAIDPSDPTQLFYSVPQVVEGPAPEVIVVATSETWVRIRSADKTVIYEGVMQAGDSYTVPALEEAPTLRTGQSGAVYFAMNGEFYGPAGSRGSVTSNLPLAVAALDELYEPASLQEDTALATMVAELQQAAGTVSQEQADPAE